MRQIKRWIIEAVTGRRFIKGRYGWLSSLRPLKQMLVFVTALAVVRAVVFAVYALTH